MSKTAFNMQKGGLIEPHHEKLPMWFLTDQTQTGLYRHRRWLEA